ncbi:MAG: YvcK family protein [Oscillospiraceae bacterium]|nr:YvcK family protein [Oscillospiraceae bacterium]
MAERINRPSAPRIVVIGGGTGQSTILRGLKNVSPSITAIVSVADNGGGSGVLRQELGMPPPGDVRNCLQALANTEPTMEALLAYRFKEGTLKGQSFGNLFLAALNDMCGSFDEAVSRMSDVLAITGRVLPVTNADVQLIADFDDGSTVVGECEIAEYKRGEQRRIRRVYLSPERPAAIPGCLEAIARADLILLGPGSLYTSVIPNLLVDGIARAIHDSDAAKVYVMNLMTQDGETEGFTACDHVKALFDHGGEGLFDHCLINNKPIPPAALELYRREGAAPIAVDVTALARMGVRAEFAPVADHTRGGLVRHDPAALAEAVIDLYRRISPTRIY